MKMAINEATTMPATFERDVEAYAAAGFRAIELWLPKVEDFLKRNSLADAKSLLKDNGLEPVGACFHVGVMLSTGAEREKSLREFRMKLEVCEALGAPVLVVPTDFPNEKVEMGDYERAAAGLAEAADLAAAHGISLAVEFIRGAKLIGTLRTAVDLVRRAGKKNTGVLLDTFHFWAGASKLSDIRGLKADELLLVHVNDVSCVPAEIAEDSHRALPGDGIMPLTEILQAVSEIGYEGYYSLELFDQRLWGMDVREAATLAFEAMCRLSGERAQGG